MEKQILSILKSEVDKLEVALIIAETSMDIMSKAQISGDQAQRVAEQTNMLQSTINMNKLLIAELKNKIKKEETRHE